MNFLKNTWDKFVEGFETGVYNILLFALGVLDKLDLPMITAMLPEGFGTVLMALGLAGIVLRYFVELPWFKKFRKPDEPI